MSKSVVLILFSVLSSFKLFLELEPQIRDIIFKFYESKYASCLKLLDEMKVRAENLCQATVSVVVIEQRSLLVYDMTWQCIMYFLMIILSV